MGACCARNKFPEIPPIPTSELHEFPKDDVIEEQLKRIETEFKNMEQRAVEKPPSPSCKFGYHIYMANMQRKIKDLETRDDTKTETSTDERYIFDGDLKLPVQKKAMHSIEKFFLANIQKQQLNNPTHDVLVQFDNITQQPSNIFDTNKSRLILRNKTMLLRIILHWTDYLLSTDVISICCKYFSIIEPAPKMKRYLVNPGRIQQYIFEDGNEHIFKSLKNTPNLIGSTDVLKITVLKDLSLDRDKHNEIKCDGGTIILNVMGNLNIKTISAMNGGNIYIKCGGDAVIGSIRTCAKDINQDDDDIDRQKGNVYVDVWRKFTIHSHYVVGLNMGGIYSGNIDIEAGELWIGQNCKIKAFTDNLRIYSRGGLYFRTNVTNVWAKNAIHLSYDTVNF